MPRLIINYPEGFTALRAIDLASRVVAQGRISADGKQFCYATSFSSASVCADRTRTGTDVFHISVN